MRLSTIILLTSCVLLLATATHAQTIRRVNNNPGVTGVNVYTTAQAAHDAAAANDILMIEPSPTTYGSLTLTKPLKIYGNGYYLGSNPELKADLRSSTLGQIDFNTGSDGSEMSGISWDYVGGTGINIFGVSNIKLYRNNITLIYIFNSNKSSTLNTNVNNIQVIGNMLLGWSSVGPINGNPSSSYTISNVLITNNIITYPGYISFTAIVASSSGITGWIVRNNTFTTNLSVSLINSIFENNVFSAGTTLSFTNVSYSYNVSSGNTFVGGVSNQNNYDVASQVMGTGTGISVDESYQIKPGSPLKTAGSGGTEVGAYGGSTPYVVSGIPAIPSTTSLNNTATGSNTVPLQITISVKGNN